MKNTPTSQSLVFLQELTKGVDTDTPSFQDSALWVANKDVSDDVVYQLLTTIYTDEGLAHMVGQKKPSSICPSKMV